ncbi:MAG: ImmA/IrrE family metallo-endopeptidase [Patescibacteria group bacterium]
MDSIKAKKIAEELLEKYKISKPIVNVFDIVKNEGIKIKFVDMVGKLENVAGFYDEESKTIFVNDDDNANKQIFTVAHELGHYALQHETDKFGVLYRMQFLDGENSDTEKEANCFAANLLVPDRMLKEVMDKYNLNSKDGDLLASLFGVSKEMMGYRMKLLNSV